MINSVYIYLMYDTLPSHLPGELSIRGCREEKNSFLVTLSFAQCLYSSPIHYTITFLLGKMYKMNEENNEKALPSQSLFSSGINSQNCSIFALTVKNIRSITFVRRFNETGLTRKPSVLSLQQRRKPTFQPNQQANEVTLVATPGGAVK